MTSTPVATWHAASAGRTFALPAHLAPRAWLTRAFELALIWFERARQRRQLGELNDYMLKDIGLSRADVVGETAKSFWRP
jgi:uncharacterized protein YjiS (DUF1127 family)